MNTIPHIIGEDAVWLESKAVEQLHRVAAQPGCCAAVGMPDLHPGRGIPIGAAFAFHDRVVPALVGGDAGCGVRLVALPRLKSKGDALLRRVDEATRGPALPEVDPQAALEAVWRHGPRGLALVNGVPDSLVELAEDEPDDALPASGVLPEDTRAGFQLGTVGGGNHFLELGEFNKPDDRDAARALGVRGFAVLAHSGSRGLGGPIADRWRGGLLTDAADQQAYLADLAGACRYARANRLILVWRMLTAVGGVRRATAHFDLLHNAVWPTQLLDRKVFLHRKGAAPAHPGEPTVVLGSRGTPSWVMRGSGTPNTLWSVAHGAGRKMGRSEAVAKLSSKLRRADLTRTATGRVLCDDAQLLFAEHPAAYKPIAPIIDSLEVAGAATRVVAITPRITVKRQEAGHAR